MARIVIDARELRSSTGRYVERLLNYLQQIDSEHEYKVLLKPEDYVGWKTTAANFEKLVCPYKEFSFGEQLGYARQLRRLKPDLVHFPMVQQPAFYRGRTVTTMNDLTTARYKNPSKNSFVFSFKQRVYRWLNRKVAHKTDAILTYSRFVKDDVVYFTGTDPEKIVVTYLAADKIELPAEPMPDLVGRQFLLYVGRPMSHKNLERLIDALSILQTSHAGLTLVLAGNKDANYQRLERSTQEKGVKDVVFPGFVNEGELRWLYENCAAYVFPSLSEGFGLPGLEAMAHGAPVVSSNATCLPEIYGEAALYFDPLDTEAMATAISEVLDNKKLRYSLIRDGSKQSKKYSWLRLAEQTLSVYKKVLSY